MANEAEFQAFSTLETTLVSKMFSLMAGYEMIFLMLIILLSFSEHVVKTDCLKFGNAAILKHLTRQR